MTYLTLGISLKCQKYREADRLYTIYTKEYGKIELLARGASKIKSKLAGHLEPGLLSNLMIASGKSWDILAQAKTVFFSNFLQNLGYNSNFSDNYQKFILFLSCLEVLDKLTKLEDPHPEVFDLLFSILKCLDQSNQISMGYCWIFFFKLFYLLGYGPDLEKCVKCKAPNISNQVLKKLGLTEYILSLSDGGLICRNCFHSAVEPLHATALRRQATDRRVFSDNLLQVAEIHLLKNFLVADILKDDIIVNEKFKKIIWEYLKYVLEGREIISFALI